MVQVLLGVQEVPVEPLVAVLLQVVGQVMQDKETLLEEVQAQALDLVAVVVQVVALVAVAALGAVLGLEAGQAVVCLEAGE